MREEEERKRGREEERKRGREEERKRGREEERKRRRERIEEKVNGIEEDGRLKQGLKQTRERSKGNDCGQD